MRVQELTQDHGPPVPDIESRVHAVSQLHDGVVEFAGRLGHEGVDKGVLCPAERFLRGGQEAVPADGLGSGGAGVRRESYRAPERRQAHLELLLDPGRENAHHIIGVIGH
ncbi:hypothetical protein ACIQXD_33005 [Streptomyces uncialis]|uniref:hypothetical protein n=1 Tax=Streptomyces uncialis TaxID=1048205 RepID=UPI00381E3ACA